MEWNEREWNGMECTALPWNALHCTAMQRSALQCNVTVARRCPSARGTRPYRQPRVFELEPLGDLVRGSSRWRVITSGVAPFSTRVPATATTRCVPARALAPPPRGEDDLVVRHDEDAPHPRRVLLDGAQREAKLVRVAVPSGGEEGDDIEARRRSAVLRVTRRARGGTLTPR